MIRDTGIPHRPQKNGVKMAQLPDAVLRHHPAIFKVVFAAPRVVLKLEGKPAIQPGSLL